MDTTEKKSPSRMHKPSADVLFYIALSANWTEAIVFISFAIAFTIIRYCQKGWWRALRSIVFFVLGLTLGVELLTGFIGMSLAFAFISIPLFILAIWLFLAG
jgi:hypothetical protein